MSPDCIAVELSTVRQIKSILRNAVDNAEELLAYHDEARGRTTEKNLMTAEMYESEIANARNMIALLNSMDNTPPTEEPPHG